MNYRSNGLPCLSSHNQGPRQGVQLPTKTVAQMADLESASTTLPVKILRASEERNIRHLRYVYKYNFGMDNARSCLLTFGLIQDRI